jgi:hypothetical protein
MTYAIAGLCDHRIGIEAVQNPFTRLLAVTVTLMSLLLPIAATAGSDNYGQYFCVAENIAGVINTNKEGGRTMYSGKIDIPDEETKFFITVGPVTHDYLQEFCKKSVDYWFNKFFENRSPPRINIMDPDTIGSLCFASDKIAWKSLDGKLTFDFHGYGGDRGYQYYGYEPSTWFNLYEDAGHTFELGLGGLYQGPVVEEGHCTKIEPPK